MTPVGNAIEIHQTLHGYRDGHELLASSFQLTSPSRRTMLALSDLSGDGSPRGFEDYLSGYPLEDAGMYAFARTWIAPEMSRPGCVWTHSLLISLRDLGGLSELGALRAHFRRPESSRIPATLSPIRHGDQEEAVGTAMRLDGASYEILTRLYGQELPVLIIGDSACQFEETFIQVWSQQWERLRGSFAFCTGSLEPRLVEKRPFDLQVIPQQRQRRTLRAADKFSIVTEEDVLRSTGVATRVRGVLAELLPLEERVLTLDLANRESPGPIVREVGDSQRWRDILVQDLVHRNSPLRRFVESYSGDVPCRRTAYRDLIECWSLVETVDAVGTSLRDLTNTVATAFPAKSDAAVLKTAILGSPSIVRGAKEADLVHELLTLPAASAFDPIGLDVEARVQRLFREGKRWRASSVAWLLTTSDLNETGRAWSASVLAKLSVDDLSGIFSEDRDLFVRLLKEHPALAAHERLWQQPRELQRAAVKALPSVGEEGRLQDVISSIVAANAAGLASTLVQELGPAIVRRILTGLDQARRDRRDLDEWQWSSNLRGYDAQFVEWITVAEQAESWTLALVVSLLGVHNSVLSKIASSAFVRHLSASTSDQGSWAVDYAAFCLTIGLRNYNGDAGTLTAAAFSSVHEAALRSQISRRAWQWLGPSLPRPSWLSFENWDDGEKLRRALIEAFLRYRWDPQLLRGAVESDQTRRWIVRYCESFDSGKDLLQRAQLA